MTDMKDQDPAPVRMIGPRKIMATAATAILLLAGGCTNTPTADKYAAEDRAVEYRLGSGDTVAINVFGDESLSGEHNLDGEGNLTMPLVGGVSANGLTPAELQQKLETQLAEYMQDPRVTVQVVEYRPFYIVGEVRKPGSYPYVEGMTVVNAVALAGGYTYRAKKEDYLLRRKDEDDSQALLAKDLTPVLPGDVITVRERYF